MKIARFGRVVAFPMLGIVGLVAPPARAQMIGVGQGVTVTLSYSWSEQPFGNGNGVLDPGESAVICLTLAFSGQGQNVTFSPAIGTSTSGTIVGLGSAYLDLTSTNALAAGLYNNGLTSPTSTSVGPNANASGTAGFGVRGGWRGQGNVNNGTTSTTGPGPYGVFGITPGQFPTSPLTANIDNPVMCIDRLGWTPASYPSSPTTVHFTASAASAAGNNVIGLYLDLGGGSGGFAYVDPSDITYFGPGGIDIPIAPAPAGWGVMMAGGLAAARRRRS